MCDPVTLGLGATLLSTGLSVAQATQGQPKPPKPPQLPKPPQAPKAPDQTKARSNNQDAAVRAGIASTYKTPLGGVPVGSLNLGSARLLGG